MKRSDGPAALVILRSGRFHDLDRISARRGRRTPPPRGGGPPEPTPAWRRRPRPPSDDHPRATTTTAPPTTKRATEPTLRPAAGVTVQVLNGVWVTGLAHRVAGQVRTAGYDVVAAKTALGSYSVSRVYYPGDHRADAEAFKDRFPAFAVVEPAPPNLSRRVALHVVIGKDYPGV